MNEKLDKIFCNSKKINIDDNSKIVIMSDCHRGSGNNYDNFSKNKNIYQVALRRYFINGFTYIELGDGDEMWEVSNYNDIVNEHIDTFKLLKKFHDNNRLIMIYGNHDIDKKDNKVLEKSFYKYYSNKDKKEVALLDNLEVYESLVLSYYNHDIFMLHGHQVDILNGTFYRLARFLVRHVWKHFERFIINDPTSAAKNYNISKNVEKRLNNWSLKKNKILIAGHTHRPIFPVVGNSLYFNDGACVHPNGITCLEIKKGKITLVKWSLKLSKNKYIIPKRDVIAGSEAIDRFYK